MRQLNQQGQIVVVMVLLVPFFVLLTVLSAQFAKLVLTKVQLQGTIDQAVFTGADYLTEALNQIAQSNRKVHEEFLRLQQSFKNLSKPKTTEAAIKEINKTWDLQNAIFGEKIEPLVEEAYSKSYQIAQAVVAQRFPQAQFTPFYFSAIQMGEGRTEILPFGEIKGIVFDPKGYGKVKKKDFEARYAFVKNDDPNMKVALAAGIELPDSKIPLRATAAAQPYGGSIWGYALQPAKQKLYRTAWVPLKTLPPSGYKNLWKGFNPYAVEH